MGLQARQETRTEAATTGKFSQNDTTGPCDHTPSPSQKTEVSALQYNPNCESLRVTEYVSSERADRLTLVTLLETPV
jgi:hypothetical protein